MKLTNLLSQTFKEMIPYTLKTFYKKNFRKFNGLKKIDEKMLKYINYENGYFIEMGAHDGVHNSNTLYFEKHKSCSDKFFDCSYKSIYTFRVPSLR